MSPVKAHFSTMKITPQMVEHIINVLKDKSYGSIEIYIENYHIVQITERTITKIVNPKPQGNFQIEKTQTKASA